MYSEECPKQHIGVASLKIIQKDPLNPPKGGLTERHRLIGPLDHFTIGQLTPADDMGWPSARNLSKIPFKINLKSNVCVTDS